MVIDRWFCLLVFQDRESRVREKKKRRGNQREVKGKKKEESESSRIPSKGLAGGDGEAGGRPRRWPRKGSGGGRGREEKDGILKRKSATSRGDLHKTVGGRLPHLTLRTGAACHLTYSEAEIVGLSTKP